MDSDTTSLTIDDTVYELAKEINGEQYLELRRRSIEVIESSNGNGEPSARVREDEYDFWNLKFRLVSPSLTVEEVKKLKRKIYQPLSLLAARLDADEAKGISDFLRENSSIFQLSSLISVLSSDSPQPILEAISE